MINHTRQKQGPMQKKSSFLSRGEVLTHTQFRTKMKTKTSSTHPSNPRVYPRNFLIQQERKSPNPPKNSPPIPLTLPAHHPLPLIINFKAPTKMGSTPPATNSPQNTPGVKPPSSVSKPSGASPSPLSVS